MSNSVNDKNSLMKKAFGLGIISIFSYLSSYLLRNLLSVATPNMLLTGEYTSEYIGVLSSVYFLMYAIGQLINGFIGDMVNPKYMITAGLSVSGMAITLFPFVPFVWMQVGCFVLMGFGLSMLRGPIMKMVSENLPKDHSRAICTFLTVASFAGPLVASMLAIFFNWNFMFIVSGGITFGIALITFITLTVFEKKKYFIFNSNKNTGRGGYLQLFKLDNFVFYVIVGGVVEIAGSAITFWIPTYLSDELNFDVVASNVLYSVISVVCALAPFITLIIFKLVKERDIAMMRVGFLIAVVSFVGMILVSGVWFKVALLLIAKTSLSCCSSVLWSIYIPGMGSTGKVSSINGVIDCFGYFSATAANAVFAHFLGLNWNGVIAIWCGISGVGLVASLVVKNKKNRKAENV